jgi:tetratricopeptide (TPR) repeat protein
VELEEAIRTNPANGLAKYKKACVLFALGRYDQVLAELLALEQAAPKEASIHCLLGKVSNSHLKLSDFFAYLLYGTTGSQEARRQGSSPAVLPHSP